MNNMSMRTRSGALSFRAPVVINQLGPELRGAIVDHWSRPWIIDHPTDRPPWQIPAGADVLLTRPNAGWERAPASGPSGWPYDLRWIQTASTGIDLFPRWLTEAPVVTTGRGVAAIPIAEYVMAAILAFEKRLHERRAVGSKDWGKGSLGSVYGKKIGIAGFGSIGRAVAERAFVFGMSVKVLRRSTWLEPEPGIQLAANIQELIEDVDHLVLALPATSKTTHLVNAEVLARARSTLHLINVARGRIIDQAALLRALDTGKLAAATLDVTDPEPPADDDPIYRHPKIVLTPHISWSGGESAKLLSDKIIANLDAYARGAALADIYDKALEY
jgi:phosphoglycerate dehydrogenase-like enzyme